MPVPEGYVVEPNKGKKFTPIPADKYQVMIYDVNPVTELDFNKTKEVDKLNFVFVVLDDKEYQAEDEEGKMQTASTRGRRLWRKVTRSFSSGGQFKASFFFELMCAIERKQLTKEDLHAVNPNDLIGSQLCVFVDIKGEWNNIESFLPAQKDLEPMLTALDQEDLADTDLEKIAKAVDPGKSEKNDEKEDDFIASLK